MVTEVQISLGLRSQQENLVAQDTYLSWRRLHQNFFMNLLSSFLRSFSKGQFSWKHFAHVGQASLKLVTKFTLEASSQLEETFHEVDEIYQLFWHDVCEFKLPKSWSCVILIWIPKLTSDSGNMFTECVCWKKLSCTHYKNIQSENCTLLISWVKLSELPW